MMPRLILEVDGVTVKAWFVDGELIIRVIDKDASTFIVKQGSLEEYPDYVKTIVELVRNIAKEAIPLKNELSRIANSGLIYTDNYP